MTEKGYKQGVIGYLEFHEIYKSRISAEILILQDIVLTEIG